jgi:hypothetical protein
MLVFSQRQLPVILGDMQTLEKAKQHPVAIAIADQQDFVIHDTRVTRIRLPKSSGWHCRRLQPC